MLSIIKNNWKSIVLVVAVPIAINYFLMTWKAPFLQGDSSDWLGFLSNYSGGIIGGIVALKVAREQTRNERERIKREHRSFFSASTIVFNFKDDDKWGRKEKRRILLTDSYKNLLATDKETSYYSVIRFGGSDVIINCKFKIIVGSDKNFSNTDTIEAWVDFFEKDEEILIPLCSSKLGQYQPWVKEIQAEYYTPANEKVKFIQSEVDNTRKHVFIDGKEEHIIEHETIYTAWAQKSM
ncbi:hypothetical protein B6A27_00320 [Anoxybacillus sp. UARK-01]|uniref:hypothetical protein n=1 Tax=Anoxybacillus sp. UARK-01 TaxID=1895648 RepID=UPI0009BADD98|nr:hypothetical protein [Anoxybacillus sp. UARK-01]OQM47524.1 hypothetical protein B6A27_00320 [Anoxybacillus sp. UARK-01]